MRRPLFYLLILLAAHPLLVLGKPLLLNGTAAVVDKTVITIQDAYLYRALTRFKAGSVPAVLIEQGEELKKSVQKLVFEEMIWAEMTKVQADESVKAELHKWLGEQKSKGRTKAWRELLTRFQVDEAGAVDKWVKTVQVEKFLQKKVETMTPIITEEEAQKYFKLNEARFKGNTFEGLKPNIVVLLKKESLQKSLEEWVRTLKEKYAVVSLLDS